VPDATYRHFTRIYECACDRTRHTEQAAWLSGVLEANGNFTL
jgi:hypothetical protein